MATTKKPTTTRRAPRKSTSTSAAKVTPVKSSAVKRAGKAIAKRPVASAAIATGVVSGVAAAVAGFLAFKKSGKSFSEFSGDVATSVKDIAGEATTRVKDGLADASTLAVDTVTRLRDGVDEPKSQSEIAEEALTLKETGPTTTIPTDPTIEDQSKVGSISY